MLWIKTIVEGLIEMYNTRDVYELLDLLDITLIRKPLNNNEKGRFFRDIFGNETIFVSNDLPKNEERLVIAHELGHVIVHTHLTTSYYTESSLLNRDKLELEANKFAAELLIPDDVESCIYEGITLQELEDILGVPKEIIKLKFNIE